jgi:L-rhamnose-H+ transport protein
MLGGFLQGGMLWPMKFMVKWPWENSWLGFSVAAYLLAPWVLAIWTVPHLSLVLMQVRPATLEMTFLYGLAWGIGTVMFGLGIAILGLGLGYAIIMGLTVSVGTLVPLLALSPQEAVSRRGLVLYIGVAAIISGIILCSYAGKLREERKRGLTVPGSSPSFRKGLALCIMAGLLIPGGNLALSFGSEIAHAARSLGASEMKAANALWPVAIFPLFVCSILYCFFLLRRNQTFSRFHQPGTRHYWMFALLMGAVQMAGISLYGAGAASMGLLGTSIGFSILMSSMIIGANILGVVSGEWKGAGARPSRFMASGLLVLTSAIFLIGYGTRP